MHPHTDSAKHLGGGGSFFSGYIQWWNFWECTFPHGIDTPAACPPAGVPAVPASPWCWPGNRDEGCSCWSPAGWGAQAYGCPWWWTRSSPSACGSGTSGPSSSRCGTGRPWSAWTRGTRSCCRRWRPGRTCCEPTPCRSLWWLGRTSCTWSGSTTTCTGVRCTQRRPWSRPLAAVCSCPGRRWTSDRGSWSWWWNWWWSPSTPSSCDRTFYFLGRSPGHVTTSVDPVRHFQPRVLQPWLHVSPLSRSTIFLINLKATYLRLSPEQRRESFSSQPFGGSGWGTILRKRREENQQRCYWNDFLRSRFLNGKISQLFH